MNPLSILSAIDLARTKPGKRSAGAALQNPNLPGAFHDQVRHNALGPAQGPIQTVVQEPFLNVPESQRQGVLDILGGDDKYARNTKGSDSGQHRVSINPNADEAYLYHELGHIASQQGKLGGLIRGLRDNPKLTKALGKALIAAPIGAAALIPGDDDLAQSVVLAYATQAPELLDEAMASLNGLSMMNRAGSRASLGQRGKMAGAYLSYLGAPLIAGLGGNFAGNLADDELTSMLGYG